MSIIFRDFAEQYLKTMDRSTITLKKNREALKIYICSVIGDFNIESISELDIEQVFMNRVLFTRNERMVTCIYHFLNEIFDNAQKKNLVQVNPVLHIYNPIVFSHEKLILDDVNVKLTKDSYFVDVACMWLKNQNYKPVTYNLYYHFLKSYIHPFIGAKIISLLHKRDILKIYRHFNTVVTNATWIDQIHLVMRMIFQYADNLGIVVENPLMTINDPHLEPILDLDSVQKNKVREAFRKYGFRKHKVRELSRALFDAFSLDRMNSEANAYINREGIRRNDITFYDVFRNWHTYTQDGVKSLNTARSRALQIDVYVIPNIGEKPIQKVTKADIRAIINTHSLMQSVQDDRLLGCLRSIYDYAISKYYVTENVAKDLKENRSGEIERRALTDKEIQRFLRICDEKNSVYSWILALALCIGLRIGEAIALKTDDVNMELQTLKIQGQALNGKIIPATKSRAGRKVRLSKTAIYFLNKAIAWQQENKTRNEYDLIFTNSRGEMLRYTTIRRRLIEIANEMCCPDITAHVLRHTYTTLSARSGENLDQIQSHVGHRFASSVTARYLHETEDTRHDSAIRRQAYLKKILDKYNSTT